MIGAELLTRFIPGKNPGDYVFLRSAISTGINLNQMDGNPSSIMMTWQTGTSMQEGHKYRYVLDGLAWEAYADLLLYRFDFGDTVSTAIRPFSAATSKLTMGKAN